MVKRLPDRRSFLLAAGGAVAAVAGCAADPPETSPAPAAAPATRLLSPWQSLAGGWLLQGNELPQAARPGGARVNFVQPVGVAARSDVLLVADAGARVLWRLDRARDALQRLASYPGSVPEAAGSVQLAGDFGAWVVHPTERVVVQYDLRGRPLRRFGNEFDLPRPVAVAVPESRTEVLVGDAATVRVVVFDPLGNVRGVLGGSRPTPLQSIAAMALGPRGLYVLDRIAQQVVVLDAAGLPVEVIGEHQLVQPRALAVDASGRVFVSDEAQQRIKVFRGPRLLASYGGAGAGERSFGRIEALAIDNNLLYVADSANARVQVLLVAPPSMESAEARP